MLERFFKLREQGTTIRTEIVAGLTTFLTMAYIIFVQPAVLSGGMFGFETGMDAGALIVATCVSSAIATLIMGLAANYPVALAPGMGQNFFFTLNVLPAIAAVAAAQGWEGVVPWQVALGVVFISGVLFLALSLVGVREVLLNAISPSMKHAIAVGIGLFIAFIGMKNGGLIVAAPGTFVKLNTHFLSPDIVLFFAGLIFVAVLHTRGIKGSILWGILAMTVLAVTARYGLAASPLREQPLVKESMLMTFFTINGQFISAPPSVAPTAFKMDFVHALTLPMIPYIVVFLFMDVFDTIGTLIGVTEQAGLMKDNKLPRAGQAFMADAVGTVAGAALGTSTVTSYIESAAGVEEGGRTGLTAVVVAICFLLALFFSPLIGMVGSYPVITAPALVLVGAMMMRNVIRIDWRDESEAIPSFLTIISIPLCFNIGDGLAIGFITYPLIKLLSGRGREVRWLMYVLAVVLVAYFVLARETIG